MKATARLDLFLSRIADSFRFARTGAQGFGLCAGLAMLILLVPGRFAVAQNEYTIEQQENWVFQQDGNASNARRRLESHLVVHVDEIELACKLNEEQKKRLQLAGRGDIKRFFDSYEKLRITFNPIKTDRADFQEVYQKFWQDIRPVQASLQAGLFEADSLFGKIVSSTLTSDQKNSYDALLNERHQFYFRKTIEQVVLDLDNMARLTEAQRRRLTELMTKEMKAPKRSGPYDNYYLLWQLDRLPEARIRLLFDEVQRKAVDPQLKQASNVAQSLGANKLWPGNESDKEVETPSEPKPMFLKKR